MNDLADTDRTLMGVAALGIVVLMLPAVALAVLLPAPAPTAAAELVVHFARYRGLVLTALSLSALGWGGVLLVFAGGLYAVLRRAEGGSAPWSLVAFAGCVATAVAILTALTFIAVVAHRAPAIDRQTASVLYDAGGVANLMTAFPNAVYTFAVAIVVRRTAVLPRWIAYGALAVAAIHLASAASWAHEGALGPWGALPSLAPLSHTAWLAAIAAVTLRRSPR